VAKGGDNMSREIPEKRLMTEDAIRAIEEGKGSEIVRLEILYKVELVREKPILWLGFNDPEVLESIYYALKKSDDAYTRGIGEGIINVVKDIAEIDESEE
jgi:hypothetical protein